MDQVLQNIVSLLWIIYLNSCCAHLGYPASTIYYIWCQFHNSLLVLNQKETSTNKPSLDSLLVQCACSIPWTELDLKDATATGKCKRWVLGLSHAPNNAETKQNYSGWFFCVCLRLSPGWVRKSHLPVSPHCRGSPKPQQHGHGELTLQGTGSSLSLWAGNAVNFIHTFPMNITLFNKDCTLFVPLPRSFLPC